MTIATRRLIKGVHCPRGGPAGFRILINHRHHTAHFTSHGLISASVTAIFIRQPTNRQLSVIISTFAPLYRMMMPAVNVQAGNRSLDNTRSRRVVAEKNISIIRVKWFSIPIDWLNQDSASNLYRCHHHRVYLEEDDAGVVGANSN